MYNHIIEFAPPPNPRTCSTVMCKSLYEKVMLEFKAIALPPPVTAIETADCSSEANQGLILRSYERLRFQVFVTVMLYFWGGVWRQGCCYEYIGSALKRDTDNHMTSYDVMPIRWISQAVSQTSTPQLPLPPPPPPPKTMSRSHRREAPEKVSRLEGETQCWAFRPGVPRLEGGPSKQQLCSK